MDVSYNKWLLVFLLSINIQIVGTAQSSSISEPHPNTYSFAVVPQFTGLAVHRDWTPIINYLNKHTKHHFQLKQYPGIIDFERAILAGEADFAYMNPYHAVMAKHAQNYEPIIRDSKRSLTGILVVRNDSPYYSVKDLEGKTIAFASPNAFAAALYMRALLHEKEKINFTPLYVKTHSNAYRYTLLGKSDASGAVYRTLNRERTEVAEKLRIIYKTPSTPSHPITAHSRIPSDVVTAVQNTIAKLAESSAGKKLLSSVLIPDPVNADYAKDYAFLEDLKLEKYVVIPRKLSVDDFNK